MSSNILQLTISLIITCIFSVSLFSLSLACAEEKNPSTINGKEIYMQLCAHCHGQLGEPSKEISDLLAPAPTDLTNEKYRHGDTLEQIMHSIRQGIGSNMLRFKERLSEEQIEAVARYVQTLKKSTSNHEKSSSQD